MPTKDSSQQFVADLAKGRRCPSFKSTFWRSEKVTVGLNLFLHLFLWFDSFSTQNEFGGELTPSLLQCGDAVTSRWEDREDRADGRWWVSAASVWEGNWWKTRRSWSWLVRSSDWISHYVSTKVRQLSVRGKARWILTMLNAIFAVVTFINLTNVQTAEVGETVGQDQPRCADVTCSNGRALLC